MAARTYESIRDPFESQRTRAEVAGPREDGVQRTPRKRKPSHERTKGSARTTGHYLRRHAGSKLSKRYGGYAQSSDRTESVEQRLGRKVGASAKPNHPSRSVNLDEVFQKTDVTPVLPMDDDLPFGP